MAGLSETGADAAVFGFIGTGHPFHGPLRRLRERIARSPAFAQLQARTAAGQPTSLHAEIKGDYRADGWAIGRFYYSIQYPEPERPGAYYAWSLHQGPNGTVPQAVEFPRDPKLAALDRMWPGAGERVLRYVPLRRVTFLQPADHAGPERIGKLKKPHRCRDGYARLQAVAAAAADAGCTIPRPLGVDAPRGLFYQQKVPGREVGTLLDRANHRVHLAAVGELHGRLGRLPVRNMPRWDRQGVLGNLWQDLDWIGFHLPEHQPLLERLSHRLHRRIAALAPAPAAFCHGDFACSQVLRHDGGWSVVDFDLAGVGDPYQDVAMFLVSLAYDVPLFGRSPELLEAAAGCYLDGYRDAAAQVLDGPTLDWYRACAEIYHLALVLKKDRYCEAACRRALQRLCRLLEVH
jgi:tRNA A-37 threonylcarbamoyl transferase component Bud32